MKLTVSRQGMLLALIPLVLQVALFIFIQREMSIANQLNDWFTHSKDVIKLLSSIETNIVDIETKMRGFVLRGAKDQTDARVLLVAELTDRLGKLQTLVKDNGVTQAIAAELQIATLQWIKVQENYLANGYEKTANEINRIEYRALLYNLRDLIARFAKTEGTLEEERRVMYAKQRQRTTYLSIASLVVWMLLVGVLAHLFTQRVGKRISTLTESVKELAGNAGEHNAESDGDEMQSLERSIAGIQAKIDDNTKKVNVLQSVNAELESSNQDLQEFALVASHDLQEPLRKIMAFGSRLKEEDPNLSETSQEYLQRMTAAAERMQNLIRDLLAFSRVSSGNDKIYAIDLKDVLAGVLDDLETLIETTGASIEVGDLPIVVAEPTQMRQLFQNLISNSIKFRKTAQKPKVTVRTICGDVNAHSPRNLKVIVEDNGIGFDPRYSEKIFGVFQRLHGRDKFEGTGIGLAICRKIVQKHGWHIEATGKLNDGAAFTITVPNALAAHNQTLGGVS